jgi:hypothetical protein
MMLDKLRASMVEPKKMEMVVHIALIQTVDMMMA